MALTECLLIITGRAGFRPGGQSRPRRASTQSALQRRVGAVAKACLARRGAQALFP